MKEFFRTIRWNVFVGEMIIIFAFFFLSYFAGNNKFPHKFWIVPISTIVFGLVLLFYVYINNKIEKEKRNGTRN